MKLVSMNGVIVQCCVDFCSVLLRCAVMDCMVGWSPILMRICMPKNKNVNEIYPAPWPHRA